MTFSRPSHLGNNAPGYRWVAVCTTAALLAPLPAGAVGFGPVTESPVMGEPLALEIPLIEPGTLSTDCFQLSHHPGGSDSQFFPRKARFDLKRRTDGTQSLLIQGPEFNQPVIEFRIAITCGTQVARDYVLLLAPGRELRYAAVPPTRPVASPMADSAQPASAPEPARQLSRPGPSLEQMAGSRYPDQPRARADFKKQVRAANPDELQGVTDDAPIPLETDLKLPPEPAVKPAAAAEPPKKPAPPPPKKPAMPLAEKFADRLTIGTGEGVARVTQATGAADGALQARAETSLSRQEEMAAKLAQTESAYNELKQQFLRMETRLVAIEQERQRLREESREKTDWWMLIGAVSMLGGGVLGALLMIVLRRKRWNEHEIPVFDIGVKN